MGLTDTRGRTRQTFTLAGVAGAYPGTPLYCRQEQSSGAFDAVDELVIVVEDVPPAGAIVEVDLLEPGADPATPGAWVTAVATANAKGVYDPLRLGGYKGVRVRVKDGGAAGDVGVTIAWQG